ncbi:MAG TPA: hypothetical protein VNO43_06705, partial [Candidatus Eisenbacteria bacterium]|nr:hypothetical protein [Candidatus Eisenbacteria bacterium]
MVPSADRVLKIAPMIAAVIAAVFCAGASGRSAPVPTPAADTGGKRYEGFSALLAPESRACHYYASPLGGGDGTSVARPFKVAQFWKHAGPGKVLCLLDGMYGGADSMINPPANVNGGP